jgi:transposase-like protein
LWHLNLEVFQVCSPELLELWRERVAAVEQSGTTAQAWCQQNGIRPNLFYYWKHQLSRIHNNVPKADWLPAVVNEQLAERAQDNITLRVSGVVIEVSSGFNPALLRAVVLALGSEQC